MGNTIEVNKFYELDHEQLYYILKNKILPEFKASYGIGYWNFKLPFGKLICKDISDRDDFRGKKIIIQLKCISSVGLGISLGAPIKIYCKSLGVDSCMLEMISDKQSYTNKKFLDFVLNVYTKKVPLTSRIYRKVFPNVYFNDLLVINSDVIKKKAFNKDILESGIHYLLKLIHDKLEVEINKI